jgi:hypothetical protein
MLYVCFDVRSMGDELGLHRVEERPIQDWLLLSMIDLAGQMTSPVRNRFLSC